MSSPLALFLFAVSLIAKHAACGFVPPAEFCLPTSGLKELSGCIAMTDKQDECGAKGTNDEKINCYCTQEMLSGFLK
jgi:hypothetical protein